MKDEQDDWVAMQVPDGTDWVEYMLNISTQLISTHARHEPHSHRRTRHSSRKAQLMKNGWNPGENPARPRRPNGSSISTIR